MIRFEQLKNKPQILSCLTGLSLAAFLELLPAFGAAYETDLGQRDEQRARPRQRKRRGRPKGSLAPDRRQAGVHPVLFPNVSGADGAGVLLWDGTVPGE